MPWQHLALAVLRCWLLHLSNVFAISYRLPVGRAASGLRSNMQQAVRRQTDFVGDNASMTADLDIFEGSYVESRRMRMVKSMIEEY